MPAFDLRMTNPFPTGANGLFHGGPGDGGHGGPHWFDEFGMDLGAPVTTQVHAVFDGKVTDVKHPVPHGGEYGDQVWVRAANADLDPNASGGVGIFYTHLSSPLSIGDVVSRGDVIGTVVQFGEIPAHLHVALAERRGGTNFGVNLYSTFKATVNSSTVMVVNFKQNGSPPTVTV
ncbi:M23 family metallopeptidase [Nocardia sp. NPDC050697]|uniref:M23 family metallopeptidase n=1 Tax=Nocardia sp. NPDC050697 TaxID=3155158 RepID=UPI0033EB4F40